MSGARRRLVLDANILVRAVFGKRVREILERFEHEADFYSPDVCFEDVRRYIPSLSKKRSFDPDLAIAVLGQIGRLVIAVDQSFYEEREPEARKRIQRRDPEDWPVVAVALLLEAPIWTEDADFFGTGVATWTSQTVEIYLGGDK
jgi:predicted nucleic acid-binding protein